MKDGYVVLDPAKLKQARKKAGLTQAQAAEGVGLRRAGQIQQYESGYAAPACNTLLSLCYVYGVDSIADIMSFSQEAKPFYTRKHLSEKKSNTVVQNA